MRIIIFASAIIFIYELLSLILPLRLGLLWKIAAAVILAFGAFKDAIFQLIGGGMFFAPDLPHWVMLLGSIIYNLFIVVLPLLLCKDIIWLAAKSLHKNFNASTASVIVLSLSCAIAAYGTWEALRVPDIAEYDVTIPNLGPEFEGKRIAVLVDLHASSLNRRPLIRSIVDETNAAAPDLILLPGDFVDGTLKQREQDLKPLKLLRAPLGIFGTAGNHDYYSGYNDWMAKLSEFGITMLENKHAVIRIGSSKLVIAGVTDERGNPDIAAALAGAPNVTIILMAHRPLAARKYAKHGISLQLSGHTHGGMVPLLKNVVAKANAGFVRGWYNVGKMKLFNSPGTSLWSGFPMRLFDPAEITLLTLHCH